MPDHNIRFILNDKWETVQLTGRASQSAVEVFRFGRTESIPRDLVDPKNLSRLPKDGAQRLEEEQGIFFPPDRISIVCEDSRLKWLTYRVWRRLPAYERPLLSELLTSISDIGSDPSKYRYIVPASSDGDKKESFVQACRAQLAENLPHRVLLNEAKELESEQARMFVIARELAKVSLRQPQLYAVAGSAVVGSSENSELKSHYTVHLMDQIDWGEDHATLLAWSWGFKEEYEAYQKATPKRVRRAWFIEPNS